jgi:hypothetical protein
MLLREVGEPGRARVARWEFERTRELVRAHRTAAAPRFAAQMSLLTRVYDRSARFARLTARLDELTARSLRLTPPELGDPQRTAQALRELAEAQRISAGLREALVADHEQARREVAGSGLPEAARAQVWRVADQEFVQQLAVVEAAERAAPKVARNRELLAYLEDRRGAWTVSRDGRVRFADPLAQRALDNLLWRHAQAARVAPGPGD